ncbi:hypothetical protein ACFL35_04100 [Candidatus Riflebacteria bacterium]
MATYSIFISYVDYFNKGIVIERYKNSALEPELKKEQREILLTIVQLLIQNEVPGNRLKKIVDEAKKLTEIFSTFTWFSPYTCLSKEMLSFFLQRANSPDE